MRNAASYARLLERRGSASYFTRLDRQQAVACQAPCGAVALAESGLGEAPEVRSGHFARLIARDACGSQIPVRHKSFGRQHEYRVIGDALHE